MSREPKRPVPTSPERSRIMRAVGRRDTEPERRLHAALQALGLQFSKHATDLPGTPDIVFREAQVAVFVHGCFWHRHKGCRFATMPRSNTEYWRAKFRANVERDKRKVSELESLGWRVIVVWQCQIKDDVWKVAARIKDMLVKGRQ